MVSVFPPKRKSTYALDKLTLFFRVRVERSAPCNSASANDELAPLEFDVIVALLKFDPVSIAFEKFTPRPFVEVKSTPNR